MLVYFAIENARALNPRLKIGICGEHGGDPESVKFCHYVGMDYVSCSPYRVPIARLAAAQAVIEEASAKKAPRKAAKKAVKKAAKKSAKKVTKKAVKKAKKKVNR
jgi:pyruvate,orthophosphate dikinase